MFDYTTLRVIWWALLGTLLIGFAIMDGFDFGVAGAAQVLGRDNEERWCCWKPSSRPGKATRCGSSSPAARRSRRGRCSTRCRFPACTWRSRWCCWLSSCARWVSTFAARCTIRAGLAVGLGADLFGRGGDAGGGVAFGNLFLGVPFRFDDDLRMSWQGGFFDLLHPFALLAGLVSR
jgi:cytochrome d ubiquinol oxidase subunit II